MCGLSYDLDQEVFGWCKRLTGWGQKTDEGEAILNDNGFESVGVLYANGSADDEVWVVTNRLIGGSRKRYIERVNPSNWEETFFNSPIPPVAALDLAYYVDCGIIVQSPGTRTITGLDHLEGRWVVGLADGNALPIAPVGDSPTAKIVNQGIGTPEKTAEFVAKEVERITGKPYDPNKIKRV